MFRDPRTSDLEDFVNKHYLESAREYAVSIEKHFGDKRGAFLDTVLWNSRNQKLAGIGICAYCAKSFQPNQNFQIFCSDTHRSSFFYFLNPEKKKRGRR